MARPEKVEAVRDIAARFKESDAALLTEYRGLRVSEIAEVSRWLDRRLELIVEVAPPVQRRRWLRLRRG